MVVGVLHGVACTSHGGHVARHVQGEEWTRTSMWRVSHPTTTMRPSARRETMASRASGDPIGTRWDRLFIGVHGRGHVDFWGLKMHKALVLTY